MAEKDGGVPKHLNLALTCIAAPSCFSIFTKRDNFHDILFACLDENLLFFFIEEAKMKCVSIHDHKIAADDTFIFLLAEDSHEISSLIFSEKQYKKYSRLSSAAVVTAALRVKCQIIQILIWVYTVCSDIPVPMI